MLNYYPISLVALINAVLCDRNPIIGKIWKNLYTSNDTFKLDKIVLYNEIK